LNREAEAFPNIAVRFLIGWSYFPNTTNDGPDSGGCCTTYTVASFTCLTILAYIRGRSLVTRYSKSGAIADWQAVPSLSRVSAHGKIPVAML
jgi:hypothetical protein